MRHAEGEEEGDADEVLAVALVVGLAFVPAPARPTAAEGAPPEVAEALLLLAPAWTHPGEAARSCRCCCCRPCSCCGCVC